MLNTFSFGCLQIYQKQKSPTTAEIIGNKRESVQHFSEFHGKLRAAIALEGVQGGACSPWFVWVYYISFNFFT